MNKKIEIEKKKRENIMIKYFKLWNNHINNNKVSRVLNRSDYLLTQRKSKKKYIKIKYSHDISFRTESSLRSEEKERNKNNGYKMKKMKIKSVVINSDYLRNKSFKMEKKTIKFIDLIKKIDNKKIINQFFIAWKKGKN